MFQSHTARICGGHIPSLSRSGRREVGVLEVLDLMPAIPNLSRCGRQEAGVYEILVLMSV